MPGLKPNDDGKQSAGGKAAGTVFAAGTAIVAAPELYKVTQPFFMSLVEPNYPPQALYYLDWIWWGLWFPGVFFPVRDTTVFLWSMFAMGGALRLMREGGFGILF